VVEVAIIFIEHKNIEPGYRGLVIRFLIEVAAIRLLIEFALLNSF